MTSAHVTAWCARSLAAPTLLVVRDSAGHVFGCFTAEGWRVATRYYGSGETFVFQLQVCAFSTQHCCPSAELTHAQSML